MTPQVAQSLVWIDAHPSAGQLLLRWAEALDRLIEVCNDPLTSDRRLSAADGAVTAAEAALPAPAPQVVPRPSDVAEAIRLHTERQAA